MPRRAKGPRLYFDKKRSGYVIRDGARFVRTGTGNPDEAAKRLAQYIDKKHRPEPSSSPLIADILTAYASDIVPGKLTASNILYKIGSLLKHWEAKPASSVTARECRAYAASKPSQSAAADLKTLKAAINHWSREYAQLVPIPVVWIPPANQPRERWLTKSEAARLLFAARRQQHLKRMILLGLYTGSRPGVILGLQWDQIDLEKGVMVRMRPELATDSKKRAPPVRLGKRILMHLRRWRRLDGAHVRYLCHYEGRRVDAPHGSWKRAVTKAGLPGITPHVLRHTRATWSMQAGVPIWQVAGALGMTVRTLERVYGHHSPDWQREAAEV